MTEANPNARRRHAALLRAAISLVVLGWLLHGVDRALLRHALTTIDVRIFVLALALFAPTLLLNARRWQMLVQAPGAPVSYRQAVVLSLIGQFFNMFLIGTTGGDVVRALFAGRGETGMRRATTSVVADRAIGMCSLSAIVLVAVTPQWTAVASSAASRSVAIAGCLLAAGALGGVPLLLFARLPRLERFSLQIPPALFARALAVSLVSQAIHFAMTGAVALSVGATMPPLRFIACYSLIALLSAMPLSLSGLGVREGTAVVLFATSGVDAQHAIVFGFSVFAATAIWSLVGGVVFVSHRSRTSR